MKILIIHAYFKNIHLPEESLQEVAGFLISENAEIINSILIKVGNEEREGVEYFQAMNTVKAFFKEADCVFYFPETVKTNPLSIFLNKISQGMLSKDKIVNMMEIFGFPFFSNRKLLEDALTERNITFLQNKGILFRIIKTYQLVQSCGVDYFVRRHLGKTVNITFQIPGESMVMIENDYIKKFGSKYTRKILAEDLTDFEKCCQKNNFIIISYDKKK
jgi:hypothetical protein